MPTLTPGFGLPYPNGLDAPCDFAQQWCAFSDSFQEALDGFQDVVNRTNPAIPMIRLLRTTALNTASDDRIPFEQVSVDTANWMDFDTDPSTLYIDRGGIFVVTANAELTSIAGNSTYTLTVGINVAGTFTFYRDEQDVTAVGQAINLVTAAMFTVNAPTDVHMRVSSNNSAVLALANACLSVYWHADRSTP